MKTIEIDNKSIHFDAVGEGPAIVLLHGFLESMGIWKDFAEQLSKHFMVVTIDLPGHGRTENFSETHTMEFMADAVYSVLEALQLRQILLTGHSMGGYVAAEFAHKYPKMMAGLVFFHSHAAADTEEARKNRDRTIDIVNKDHHGFISNFIPDLFAPENKEKYGDEIQSLKNQSAGTSKKGIIAAVKGMKERAGHEEMLKKCAFPVLFISGKQDKRLPVEKLMHQAALPSHSEVLLLDRVGHMGYIEAREITLKALQHFAERTLV